MSIGFYNFIFIITAIIFFLLIAGIWIASKKKNYDLVRKFGVVILLLALPLTIVFFDYLNTGKELLIMIYFGFIFLYLLVELLFDFILNIEFRKIPALHIPYIILFYLASFGFIRISFYINITWGYLVSIAFWVALACLVYLIIAERKTYQNNI